MLRQGPPAHRKAVVDGIFGVLGVALLVFAGVLGQALPEKEVVPVQYLPEFPLNSTQARIRYVDPAGEEHASASLIFNGRQGNPPVPMEQQPHDIRILVERDNVISFKVRVVIPGDDLPSSLPDNFKFQLFDPEGTPLADHWRVLSKEPVPGDPDPANGTFEMYISPLVSHSELKRFRAQPEREFIGSNRSDFSPEEALLVASERYTLPTQGTEWSLRMTLTLAGDCPSSTDPAMAQRRAHCLSQAGQDGTDAGNPITISEVFYDYYLIEIPE